MYIRRNCAIIFGNHITQDSHKNQYPGPVLNFGFTEPQYSLIKFAAELSAMSLP